MGTPDAEDDRDPSSDEERPGIDDEIGEEPAGDAELDDALGPSADLDDELDVLEGGGLDDAGAEDLDIGGMDGGFADREGDHDDSAGIAGADEAFEPDFQDRAEERDDEPQQELPTGEPEEALPWSADDGGAEGIGDGSEAEVDEASLPAMDADAGGDFELPDLLREMGFEEPEPWEPVASLAGDDALCSVVVAHGAMAAAGSAIVALERGATAPRLRPLVERANGCAIVGDQVALATRRGVELSELARLPEPRVVLPRADLKAISAVGSRAWALAGSSLLRVDLASGAAELALAEVTSIAASEGTLYAATARGGLSRLRGEDGAFESLPVDETARRALEAGAQLVAAAAGVLALVGEGRCTLAFVDGRALTLDAEGVRAAAVRALPGEPRVLLVARGDAGARLVEVDITGRETGEAALPAAAAAEPCAAVWDPARELALIASAQGLYTLRPRVRH